MKCSYLVLGATGSIGYAFTKVLLNRGIVTDIFVRNRFRAETLFDNHPLLRIHTGDMLDTGKLYSLSEKADYIFHGINFPYQEWRKK